VNTADNTFKTPAPIEITIPGDVDGNHAVNILDVVKITSIYGAKQGDPKFNPNCDIVGDGKITILDVVACTSHYGQEWHNKASFSGIRRGAKGPVGTLA
jgi:hypothetical protein